MQFAAISRLIAAVTSLVLFTPAAFSQTTPAPGLAPAPDLGDAPRAPKDISGLPGGGVHPLVVTGGFNINTSSREPVREFYISTYTFSQNVAMNSTAVTASCTAGTNSTDFQNATLTRINWLRALAGIPASVTFNANESTQDQAAALIMSANSTLAHIGIPPTWSCFSIPGTNAADNSNLALGSDGQDAITGYIWDFGAGNTAVGHRRWILYPQTQIMGSGDVPVQGTYLAANATWVFDANLGGPRPATRQPFVAWPPSGFVPYPLVFPQWSFALSNADFSTATVTMKSNGVPVAVALQPYQPGYGENTIVWVPMGLDATSQGTVFPFGGTDTVYSVTVTNIKVNATTVGFTYNVTSFDPAVPGTDYVAAAISGTNTPYLNTSNGYACVPITNPNLTGYQWLTAQPTNGNLTDNATNGLANFTISPPPGYPIITNPPVGSGKCFHLCHTNPVSQFLQLKETLLPATNTVLLFKGMLSYATTSESAHVQASADGGANWQDLFVEVGNNSQTDTSFVAHSLSLSNYAGQLTLVRFNYAFVGPGSYYPYTDAIYGWSITNIVVTNVLQTVNMATNSTASTNFTYTPTLPGTNLLAAAPVFFSQFPLNWGPVKLVNAVTNPAITIVLSKPVLANKQVQLDFTVSGPASTFHLLHTTNLNAAWTTNSTATFTTNIPGSSYRYTATNNAPTRFYLIQTP